METHRKLRNGAGGARFAAGRGVYTGPIASYTWVRNGIRSAWWRAGQSHSMRTGLNAPLAPTAAVKSATKVLTRAGTCQTRDYR